MREPGRTMAPLGYQCFYRTLFASGVLVSSPSLPVFDRRNIHSNPHREPSVVLCPCTEVRAYHRPTQASHTPRAAHDCKCTGADFSTAHGAHAHAHTPRTRSAHNCAHLRSEVRHGYRASGSHLEPPQAPWQRLHQSKFRLPRRQCQ